jgi:hypothetical protein
MQYIKEAADQMEEVEVGMLEKVMGYHMLKNLLNEFDNIKQIIFHERKPPLYLELESKLLTKVMPQNFFA